MIKKTVLLLLTICILFTLVGCKKNEETKISRLTSDLIVDYTHYDDTTFYEDIEKIKPLIANNNSEAIKLYDKLNNEFRYVFDLTQVAYINYDIDYTDEYWNEESEYIRKVYNGVYNAFLTIAHELSESGLANEFEEHVNNKELYGFYKDYVTLSSDMVELQNREDELVVEYYSLDYDAEDFYDRAGEIFMELLSVRNELAKGYGYDNYILYTDKNNFRRDYSEEEILPFYQAVKDMGFESVYALKDTIVDSAPEYVVDGKQSLIDLKETIKGLSKNLDEAYDYMVANDLYWYDNSELNSDTGYSLEFMNNMTPFIFNNLVENAKDLYYQVHELGHFANYYFNPNDILIVNDGAYDLCEIHSQALELLCIENINNLLGTNDKAFKYYALYRSLISIVDGCVMDEWSRKVYENPDMTLEEIDALYNEIAYEYGINEDKQDISYEWKDVSHNFEFPGYYLSYATSYFASLQLYNTSLKDRDLAIKQYDEILMIDPTVYGYKYALEKADMSMFSDYEMTSQILNDTVNVILENVND